MPLWFELVVLTLLAYAIGIALGWMIWARGDTEEAFDDAANDPTLTDPRN